MNLEGYVKSNFLENFKTEDKKAILVANFGTTHENTRKETIESLINEVKISFPDFEVRECYTSRIIQKKLKEKEIYIDNPVEAMENFKKDGFTHILVIVSNIIPGIEYDALQKNIEYFLRDFKEIRITPPLLNNSKIYLDVAHILNNFFNSSSKENSLVFVGHGTHDSSNSVYPCMDYIFKYLGYNYYVGTIEGFPSLDDIINILKRDKIKNITLIPFMFVSGEHAKNDIAIEWKERFLEEGFNTDVNLTSLGSIKEIRNIFIEFAKFLLEHKQEDMIAKKLYYSK